MIRRRGRESDHPASCDDAPVSSADPGSDERLDADLGRRLLASLAHQQRELRSTLVLNPVENFPFKDDLAVASGPLHGLYNSDKHRIRGERMDTVTQFAGRRDLERDTRQIYEAWATALQADDVTMRALSGLHAYIVLFMSVARIGQSVMLLPVEAGGHVSARPILERLGLQVLDMVVDESRMSVDIDATMALCETTPPDFILVDRSEGLVVEDFSRLTSVPGVTTVFDASQTLTQIVCGDHPNPLQVGFDLLVATTHKNFPGPQKALLATREADSTWQAVLAGLATFVSNMHTTSTYAAGLTLTRTTWLARYSREMLDVALRLEDELAARTVPVVRRARDKPSTQHIWIAQEDRATAFAAYEELEKSSILVNYRKLPYSLGYGLRLGTSAAVRIGMTVTDVPELASLIATILREGAQESLTRDARTFAASIWARALA